MMAAPAIDVADELSLKERLIRFLRIGTESNFYLPGKNKSFRSQNIALRTMIDDDTDGLEAVEIIKRINREKTYLKRDPLLHSLAVCCLSTEIPVKRAAYASVAEVCRNTGELFTFLSYIKQTTQFHNGWGAGLRKVVCDWYNNQDAMVLADLIARHQEMGRWSHKDVFRMSHIIPANEGIGFIVRVIVKGLENAKKSRPDPCPIVQSLIEFYDAVHRVRHEDNVTDAATLMDIHGLDFQLIPTTLLHSKEIWNSLLTNMKLRDVLYYLRSMSRRKFLTPPRQAEVKDPALLDIQDKVLRKVQDVEAIKNEELSPYYIYQMVRNYCNEYGPRKHLQLRNGPPASQKRSATSQGGGPPSKKQRQPPVTQPPVLTESGQKMSWKEIAIESENKASKNNRDLFDALANCYWIALDKNVKSMGKRILVAVSVSEIGYTKSILGAPSMSVGEVIAMTTQFIHRKEPAAQLGFFDETMTTVKCPTVTSMLQMVKFVADHVNKEQSEDKDGSGNVMAPLNWALEKKAEFDLFLIMSDKLRYPNSDDVSEKFNDYKTKMNLPDTKMVVCGLKSQRMYFAKGDHMLDIGGFDPTVPELIYKFVMGTLDQ